MRLTLGIIVVIGLWLDNSEEGRTNKNILKGLRGFFIIKLFNKYIKDEDNSVLEVYFDNLKRDEIKELLALLESVKFKYISVDTKTIKAVKEGHFREIYQAQKKLEKEGFGWSEKPRITYKKR
ncbi:hypothetical protein ES702_06480 [subsurface metagenome]